MNVGSTGFCSNFSRNNCEVVITKLLLLSYIYYLHKVYTYIFVIQFSIAQPGYYSTRVFHTKIINKCIRKIIYKNYYKTL